MGVNFALTFLLITISYINAQYVVLEDTDANIWDIDDQVYIPEVDRTIAYLCEKYHLTLNNEKINCADIQLLRKELSDQDGHVIHRREAPETELEGSGNDENVQTAPLEEPSNQTSVKQENEAAPAAPETIPVTQAPEKDKDNVKIEASNFAPAELPVVKSEESSKSNETDSKQPSVENQNVETKTELPVVPISLPTNEIDAKESAKVEVSNFAPAQLAVANSEDSQKSNETDSKQPNVETKTELPVVPIALPTNEIDAKENVNAEISNFAPAQLPAVKSEDSATSNETGSKDPNAENENPESKAELPVVPIPLSTNETDTKEDISPKSEVPDLPEPKSVEEIKEGEKPVSETPSPTKIPEVKEQPALPPLVHNISAESASQKPETTITPKQSAAESTGTPASKLESPIVLEKETASVNNDSNKDTEKKASPKVLPSDLVEVESINNPKESESVIDQQSGNAILFKSPKTEGASSVEGSESEKALQGMSENAKISNEPSEQPSTGESAKNVSRASKDTTILIVLFVVVIAIGGAAFTHNYIKKRKQNASSNNEIVNGIRRSLQNLSSGNGKPNTDVEQGTELKPLMKNNTLTKEYTDKKKEELA